MKEQLTLYQDNNGCTLSLNLPQLTVYVHWGLRSLLIGEFWNSWVSELAFAVFWEHLWTKAKGGLKWRSFVEYSIRFRFRIFIQHDFIEMWNKWRCKKINSFELQSEEQDKREQCLREPLVK